MHNVARNDKVAGKFKRGLKMWETGSSGVGGNTTVTSAESGDRLREILSSIDGQRTNSASRANQVGQIDRQELTRLIVESFRVPCVFPYCDDFLSI